MASDLNRQAGHIRQGREAGLQNSDLFLALTFHKDGFIDRRLEFEEIRRELPKPDGLVVVMEPSIALTGRVVAPDGRPVATFTVAAGPGKLPSASDSVRRRRPGPRRPLQPESLEGGHDLGRRRRRGVRGVGRVGGRQTRRQAARGPPVAGRRRVGQCRGARGAEEPRQGEARPSSRQVGDRRTSLPTRPPRNSRPARQPSRPTARCGSSTSAPTAIGSSSDGRGIPDDSPGARRARRRTRCGGRPHRRPHRDGPHRGPRLAPEGQRWRRLGVRQRLRGGDSVLRLPATTRPQHRVPGRRERPLQGRPRAGGSDHGRVPLPVFDVFDALHVVGPCRRGTDDGGPGVRARGAPGFHAGVRDRRWVRRRSTESGTGLGASRKVDNVTVDSRMFASAVQKNGVRAARADVPGGVGADFQRVRSRSPSPTGRSSMRSGRWCCPTSAPARTGSDSTTGSAASGSTAAPCSTREVIVPPGGRGEVPVPLGAGCITGKIPAPNAKFPILRATSGGDRRADRAAVPCRDGRAATATATSASATCRQAPTRCSSTTRTGLLPAGGREGAGRHSRCRRERRYRRERRSVA